MDGFNWLSHRSDVEKPSYFYLKDSHDEWWIGPKISNIKLLAVWYVVRRTLISRVAIGRSPTQRSGTGGKRFTSPSFRFRFKPAAPNPRNRFTLPNHIINQWVNQFGNGSHTSCSWSSRVSWLPGAGWWCRSAGNISLGSARLWILLCPSIQFQACNFTIAINIISHERVWEAASDDGNRRGPARFRQNLARCSGRSPRDSSRLFVHGREHLHYCSRPPARWGPLLYSNHPPSHSQTSSHNEVQAADGHGERWSWSSQAAHLVADAFCPSIRLPLTMSFGLGALCMFWVNCWIMSHDRLHHA
jgi:hypothetical protein